VSKSSPFINLIVIKAADIDRAASFYRLLGFSMEKHQHGSGPLHYCALAFLPSSWKFQKLALA
jgi:catechol 2,3-dioxygenase-like lactoylglutathione lyase family enzyme